jgi:hypothetical protein
MESNKRKYYGLFTILTLFGLFLFSVQNLTSPNQSDDQINYNPDDIKDFANYTTSEGIYELKIFKNANYETKSLDEFASKLQSVGISKDGIPAIDSPKYMLGSEVTTELKEWDIVFGINYKGFVAAYPQKILVWHEIVNEEIDGKKVSIAYCPLTGSTIAYLGEIDGVSTTFGVSGALINSNLVLYDRATDNFWPQILGQGITNDYLGKQLQSVQIYWSTWEQWKSAFPDTLVLTTDTGYIRSYGNDPYGSYEPGVNTSYYQFGGTLFSTQTSYNVIKSKDVVYGIQFNNSYLAVQKSALEKVKIVNYNISDKQIVLFFDEKIGTARVYERTLDSQILTFTIIDGDIRDIETNSSWNIKGQSTTGQQLNEVRYMDVFWFGWIGFFPTTELIYI